MSHGRHFELPFLSYCLTNVTVHPLLQQYLFQFEKLVVEHMPKLGQHFLEEMINPNMYASQWFITVFSYSFPFHLTLRVWDVFLYEVRILPIHICFFFGVYLSL